MCPISNFGSVIGSAGMRYQNLYRCPSLLTSQNFGCSASGAEMMKERGIDAQHVVDAARSL
jgi:hypothetical protein